LACTLLSRPELLVLDEPTVGLDPALRQEFWEHFHGLTDEGHTILLTTHYLEEAGRTSRVGFMRGGRSRWRGRRLSSRPGLLRPSGGSQQWRKDSCFCS